MIHPLQSAEKHESKILPEGYFPERNRHSLHPQWLRKILEEEHARVWRRMGEEWSSDLISRSEKWARVSDEKRAKRRAEKVKKAVEKKKQAEKVERVFLRKSKKRFASLVWKRVLTYVCDCLESLSLSSV